MKYAPILIPTLCRDKHFVRLIESLKKNTWAQYTDVYIGLDYPPNKKYEEGYIKICKYLEGDFKEFASFNVIRHKQNVGSLENMESLREAAFKKHDRFIRTDDDTEFSSNFIEFIDKCLMKYENEKEIIAVTGYSYPVQWKTSDGANVFKQNFTCPMWGVGFWRDKYLDIKKEIENGCLKQSLPNVVKHGLMKKMLSPCKCEYIDLCLSPIFKDTLAARMTDIATRMYMAVNDNFVISPVVSKVRNWGFDGSGEYCSELQNAKGCYNARTYPYNEQPVDTSNEFEISEDSLNLIDDNRRLLDKFEDVSWKRLLKVNIKIALYKFFGEKAFYKIMRY